MFPAKALSFSVASWQEITSFLLHNFSPKTKIFQKGRDDVFDSLLIHRLSQKCVALKKPI
ncbi:hypothetical protein EWX88_01500 [Enterococcus faecalis]|nr:hypothetical protein [Enterococcus faecalis]EGO8436278.1 hypothetical protein [Enterococcus faecalis]EGO8546331.1 hypothetical protein [Enterococcus faecalis]EGO8547794.1 hypothetical protein [Enterococcus faecalis]